MNPEDPNSPYHPEILQLSDLPSDADILFAFEMNMLATQDTRHFLKSLKPDPSACKADVRNLFGRVTFCFEPLELDGEIWEDAEVRAYISKLNKLWPCWLYYCVPDHQEMLPILACLCSEIATAHNSETGITAIALPADQRLPIFLRWMVNALKIAAWAGVPSKIINHRLHQWMQMLLPPEVAEDYQRNVLDLE